ncbi:hypothetical protein RFI_14899, partial [Reticulomyxa filosa]
MTGTLDWWSKILSRSWPTISGKNKHSLLHLLHHTSFILFVCFVCLNNAQKERSDTLHEINENGDDLQTEKKKAEIGEIKPGINLQGYCVNKERCLASQSELLIWINIGFCRIWSYFPNTSFPCPHCGELSVNSILKLMTYNSEYLCYVSSTKKFVRRNCYEFTHEGISKEFCTVRVMKIRQHAESIEDLIKRSTNAMRSSKIINLLKELKRHGITSMTSLKGNKRLHQKILEDYKGDFNQVFDVGRFTILCNTPTELETAVAVMKKAYQFKLIVSEDKDFFNKQSKTHHRSHNIKLYVPEHKVYVEMQATLKKYTEIENPEVSHLFYEHIRAWKPKDSPTEEELKQASDKTLTKINDIIYEWIDKQEIIKIASRYKPHSKIRILRPPQLKDMTKKEIKSKKNIPLILIQFVFKKLCKLNPKKTEGKAIYVKYIMGEKNPASCADVISVLIKSKDQELVEDKTMSQDLETYIPLQASDRLNRIHDCYKYRKQRKKSEQQQQVIILQGKSGSGKSLFCRYLEKKLWEFYINGSTTSVPVYISLPKCYNELDENQIISQTLQKKQINKDIIDIIRRNISF